MSSGHSPKNHSAGDLVSPFRRKLLLGTGALSATALLPRHVQAQQFPTAKVNTTGLAVTDTHNGLRAMTRRGAGTISLKQNRMAHASEILHQVAASGLKYVESPVTIEYSAYSLGKGQSMADALMIIVDLFARRLHR